MRLAITQLRMAAAIAESVELLDIAERYAGLFADPGAQADVERAMRQRIERARRQRRLAAVAPDIGNQNGRIIPDDRRDRRCQIDLDRQAAG